MPTYSFHCSACDHAWDELRTMSRSSEECPCPQCGSFGDHRQMGIPNFRIVGGTTSSSYNLSRNMENAKRTRSEHEARFGKHEEYVTGSPGSRRVIDPETDVTIHGDVGDSSKERMDIIERKHG